MTKEEVAAVFEEIATLLEFKGENSFRCNAYRKGAMAVLQLRGNLDDIVREDKLHGVENIGDTLREKITVLVTTGRLPFYDELKNSIPEGLMLMLKLPGMGPKKIMALHNQLGIRSLDDLKKACDEGKVAGLKGFGAKTQKKIVQGIQFIDEVGNRVRIDQALPIGIALLEQIRKMPGVIRAELGGSLRRRRETAKDIDILASSNDPAPIMEAFVSLPSVEQVVAQGETKSSIVVQQFVDTDRVTLNADLRVVSDPQFPFALAYFTGSKSHNIRMRARAQERGLKLNEYELAGDSRNVKCKDEAALFAALELDYISPEMREDTGEIDLAAWELGKSKHRLPKLIESSDIRGVFHNHTTSSDGNNSLEEMALAAMELGFEYIGIADHSQSLTIANGLSPARVAAQQKEIERLNKKLKGIRILKGIEVDILEDGRLDFEDSVLETFDYVVASVHTLFNQPIDEMTKRIVRAVMHPNVTMLGHATGRLLLKREGYKVDLDRVLAAAAVAGTMIEINAQPLRLDLDWLHCKHAKSLGIKLVINPDAHRATELAYFRWGVDVARRAWLEKSDIFNTAPLAQVLRELEIG
jgi:DNA polymerase (family 10)